MAKKKNRNLAEWYELIEVLRPSIVKIESPQGHGTGFLCAYNENETVVAIATANHVVDQADKWLQPIRLFCPASGETVVLKEDDRFVWADPQKDSAVVLVPRLKVEALKFPKTPVSFSPSGKHLKIGFEVGWLGFPSIGPDTLCFFGGKVSAWQEATSAYLIDGVAINGVSGGPVFHRTSYGPVIIGAITAYMPNRLTAGTLPGLSVAQDVSHFQEIVNRMKDWDEVERKKKEQEMQLAKLAQVQPPLVAPAAESPPDEKKPSNPTGNKRVRSS